MPLISIWTKSPADIEQLTIERVVNLAGDGVLKDNSECSKELHSYLSEVNSTKLAEYVAQCLAASFPKSGLVLQDLVNELGRRLDYEVTNGRYQGTSSHVGFDGIWRSEGHSIVVEVKTTDAFNISLDRIGEYQRKLVQSAQLSQPASILIVVGRQDTGGLEAQVRGSRFAWDVRLISVDALIRLVLLKEGTDAAETGKKIRSLLIPKEYTKLDGMIDVIFTAAKDVEDESGSDEAEDNQSDAKPSIKTKGVWQFTEFSVLQAKRNDVILALSRREDANLIKKTRALYWHPTKNLRAACTISKRYPRASVPYWYAYHPEWDEFLGEGERSFLILGCMDRKEAFAIPLDKIRSCIDALNTSEKESGKYWHIHLQENSSGELSMLLPKRKSQLALKPYALKL